MKRTFSPLPALVLVAALFGCATDPPRGAPPPDSADVLPEGEAPSVSLVMREIDPATPEAVALDPATTLVDAPEASAPADGDAGSPGEPQTVQTAETASADGGASSPSEPQPAQAVSGEAGSPVGGAAERSEAEGVSSAEVAKTEPSALPAPVSGGAGEPQPAADDLVDAPAAAEEEPSSI